MGWLSLQIVVELLIAAAFGAAIGWGLHVLYGKRATAPAKVKASPASIPVDPDTKLRVAELESKLDRASAEVDELRRRSGIGRPGDRPEAAPEGSLLWRNRHLESRVRFLESKLADLESEATPPRPKEDQNDEATRLRWRNRYLEGRVKYLEEELVRTGGLTPATGAPQAVQAAVAAKLPEGEKPELMEEPRDGRSDDLKLISGIGPKLEQKLNSIGIWHYAQIASWSQKEVDWVNSAISFRGRIEREKWIPQAVAMLERLSEASLENAETGEG